MKLGMRWTLPLLLVAYRRARSALHQLERPPFRLIVNRTHN